VLVMERLEGIKIDDLAGLEVAGYQRTEVARLAARFIAREIMENGFFHADPHPGNFFVMSPEDHAGKASPVGVGAAVSE
jgi:ubiquinone biosynthesis protein